MPRFGKNILIPVGVGLLLIAFVVQPKVLAGSSPASSRVLSLGEAYNIGLVSAVRWSPSAKLYEILSTDQGEDPVVPDVRRGLDGRRISWNMDFVIPKTEHHLRLEIRNGEVVLQTEVQGSRGDSFLETSEVTNIVIGRMLEAARLGNLQPGKAWATGYHYRLFKEDNVTTLLIRGLDDESNPAIAFFDAKKNALIARQHKLASGWSSY